MRASYGLLAAVVLFTGCSGSVVSSDRGPSAPPAASAASASASVTPAAPRCTVASSAAIAAVDASVRAKGEGNSVPAAVSYADPESGAWWLVGALAGPAGSGEGAVGIWSTTQDPTLESFSGPLFAVDGGAADWSTAPPNTVVTYDPAAVPALGCWSMKRS